MKVISIKQPWADLIAQGKKTIETRTWATKYRGTIIITASKSPAIDNLPTGCTICTAEITDCRPMLPTDEEAACCPVYPRAWAWVLSNIKPLPQIPVQGKLRLFDLDLPPQ